MRGSFRARIFSAILAVTLFGITFLFACIYCVAQDRIEENYLDAIADSMELRFSQLNAVQMDMYRATVELSVQDVLREQIEAYLAQDEQTAQDALQLSGMLSSQNALREMVDDIYLYLPQTNEIICSQEYKGVILAQAQNWLSGSMDAGFSPWITQDLYADSLNYCFLYARPIYNEQGQWIATVALSMSERNLYYNYMDVATEMQNLFLVSEDGTVCSAQRSAEIGSDIESLIGTTLSSFGVEIGSCTYNDEPCVYVMRKSPAPNMTLVSVSERDAIVEPLRQTQWLFYLVLFMDVLVVLWAASLFSDKLTEPLQKLSQAMTSVGQGDFSIRTEFTRASTEIANLSLRFNQMVQKIEELMDAVCAEQEQVKQAQMRALQYQIKPHFMYNTLNSIKFTAMLQGSDTIAQQLQAFIDLLEYSLNKEHDFARFSSEIKILNDYAALQKYRYMDCFEIVYDVSEEAKCCYVPRFLLQPLVENSILHGMDTKRQDNLIHIRAYVQGEVLCITVQDNGVGMSDEKVARLLEKNDEERRQFNGIGVSNTKERLQLFYEGEVRFTLSSKLGEGTRYEIEIPAIVQLEVYGCAEEK